MDENRRGTGTDQPEPRDVNIPAGGVVPGSYSGNTGFVDSTTNFDRTNGGTHGVEEERTPVRDGNYDEESAMEYPVRDDIRRDVNSVDQENAGGAGFGIAALVLAILSLFTAPFLFGIAAIILGFVARARGAEGLGWWSIIIGAFSLIYSLFLSPFF